MEDVLNFGWYKSIGGIVLGTGFAVEILKRLMGRFQPTLFDQLPTWVWSVIVASLLTGVFVGLGALQADGTWLEIGMQVVMLAAVAGGFKGWWDTASKPIAESTAAIRARKDLLVLLVLVPTMLFAPACGLKDNARHTAVVADTAIYSGLAAFQDSENLLYEQKRLTPEQHKEINKLLVPMLKAGQQLNRVIRAWPVGQPAPAEVQTIVSNLRSLAEVALNALPNGETKDKLFAKLSPVQSAVLALLSAFLPPPTTTGVLLYGPGFDLGMGAVGEPVVPGRERLVGRRVGRDGSAWYRGGQRAA